VALPPPPAAPAEDETVALTDPPASAEPDAEPDAEPEPDADGGTEGGTEGGTSRRRTVIMVGLVAAGLAVSLLVGVATFAISRTRHGGSAHAGSVSPVRIAADADGCHWWTADPATKANQRNVGAPPPSPARRVGHRTMTVTTNRGPIEIRIDAVQTPCTVASFTHLAVRHFYDNTACHRLVTDGIYVLQCGDPSGTGRGGPTYVFADEEARIPPLPHASGPGGLVVYPRGTVALANFGKNTNGSQFFVVYKDSPIPPGFTPFGVVSAGMGVVDEVAAAGDDGAFAPDPGGGHPKLPLVIQSLTVD
jgi:peptidyl-prolyl cis-trans isomerase B (cyclophilin B)